MVNMLPINFQPVQATNRTNYGNGLHWIIGKSRWVQWQSLKKFCFRKTLVTWRCDHHSDRQPPAFRNAYYLAHQTLIFHSVDRSRLQCNNNITNATNKSGSGNADACRSWCCCCSVLLARPHARIFVCSFISLPLDCRILTAIFLLLLLLGPNIILYANMIVFTCLVEYRFERTVLRF